MNDMFLIVESCCLKAILIDVNDIHLFITMVIDNCRVIDAISDNKRNLCCRSRTTVTRS